MLEVVYLGKQLLGFIWGNSYWGLFGETAAQGFIWGNSCSGFYLGKQLLRVLFGETAAQGFIWGNSCQVLFGETAAGFYLEKQPLGFIWKRESSLIIF